MKREATGQFFRVQLQNWKNFKQADVELPQRVFFVGPNASGKSNLLDVFRFLRDLAMPGGGFQSAVARRGGVSTIRCLAARRESDIKIHVYVILTKENQKSIWEYELVFNQDKRGRPVICKERVVKDDEELLKRPTREDERDRERLTQTYLEQVTMNQSFREFAFFLASVRYLHIVPQIVREPDRSAGRRNDPFGSDFLEQIAKTPKKTRDARLRRIQEVLRIAVPQLKKLELWCDKRGTPHLRGKYEHWRPQGAWQTEEQFSDGTLRLIGLLWAILDGTGPLLLEEPELSLHPEVIRYIPQMFARVQRRTKRQIITSTHSPELLQDEGIGLDEVILLIPGREGTELRPASQIEEAQALLEGGLTIGEIAMAHTRPENAYQLSLFGEQ